VSGFVAPVTPVIDVNPGGGILTGPNPVNEIPSNGIASFSDLEISAPAAGYTLSISSGIRPNLGTLSSVPSGAFAVEGDVSSCPGACKTNQPGSNGAASVTGTVVSGSGLLLESANAYNAQLTCKGSTSIDTNTYTFFTMTTGGNQPPLPPFAVSKVATITINDVVIPGSVTKFLHAQQICFGGTAPFTTASGTQLNAGSLPDGSLGYIGVLPNCTGSSGGPCEDQNSDSATPTPTDSTYTVNLVADIPSTYTGDPWIH
jgi:hypothetical protein